MSFSLGGANEAVDEDAPPPVETNPSANRQRRLDMAKEEMKVEQHKLGGATLAAVDHLTGMSADEIEVVADRLMEGARETEAVIRELARRVREYGVFAGERLANFVRTANDCADVARSMQTSLEKRDEPPAAQPAAEAPAAANDRQAATDKGANVQRPVDLNALGADLGILGAELTPPIQPDDEPDMAVPRSHATPDAAPATNGPSGRRTSIGSKKPK